ncbi:MAG: hypothetical protein KGI51_06105, partial [Rhodospirillales bacterium]|nr:hypothetical protein [Rhodospirillales bacterium]
MSGNGRFRAFSSLDRPRRRFVQDGEVNVTVVNPRPRQGLDALGPVRSAVSPHERAEAAEAALAAERAQHERTERSLRDAQAALLDLRTKQGHADLARTEAEQRLAEARAELAALRMAMPPAPAAAPVEGDAAIVVTRRRGRPPKQATDGEASPAAPKRRGRPPKQATAAEGAPPAPKRRGRPPKQAPALEGAPVAP